MEPLFLRGLLLRGTFSTSGTGTWWFPPACLSTWNSPRASLSGVKNASRMLNGVPNGLFPQNSITSNRPRGCRYTIFCSALFGFRTAHLQSLAQKLLQLNTLQLILSFSLPDIVFACIEACLLCTPLTQAPFPATHMLHSLSISRKNSAFHALCRMASFSFCSNARMTANSCRATNNPQPQPIRIITNEIPLHQPSSHAAAASPMAPPQLNATILHKGFTFFLTPISVLRYHWRYRLSSKPHAAHRECAAQ